MANTLVKLSREDGEAFRGDADHRIDTTGNVVRGDEIAFVRATFTGSFRRAKFAGYELVVGTVMANRTARNAASTRSSSNALTARSC